jgi:hypothetical protein
VGEAMLGMHLALVAAYHAGLYTRLQRSARRGKVEGGLAREDPAGRQAHVGAIAAEADAADHRLHLRLREVGIGVGGAGLGAVEARLDAFDECVYIHGWLAGVSLGNRRSVRHD